MLVIAIDNQSVRVFDRRVEGRVVEFASVPERASRAGARAMSPTPGHASAPRADTRGQEESATRAARVVDFETASEWDFGGRATSGPRVGRQLRRIPHLVEYWFDWQTFHPQTEVYRSWRPASERPDPMAVPRPPAS
jgi:hypothetical protein